MAHRAARSHDFSRPVSIAWMLSLLALPAGCSKVDAERFQAPSEIIPVVNADLADKWYRQWASQRDIPSDEVRDMVFMLGTQARDWRDEPGPDGYAMRIVLVGPEKEPVQAEGSIKVILVERPHHWSSQGAFAWHLSAAETRQRFRQDGISGYVLRLDWGSGPAQQRGIFMIAVRWIGKDGRTRLTRNIQFEEVVFHDRSATTRPVENRVGAGAGGGDAGRGARVGG